MLRTLTHLLTLLFSVSLLTLMLNAELPGIAQPLPQLGWSEGDVNTPPAIPVSVNGNLEMAPVFLDGKVIGTVSAFADLPSGQSEGSASSHSAAIRSYMIHNQLQKILDNMTRYAQEVLSQKGLSVDAQEGILKEELVVTVSQANQTAVVLVEFPRDDVPEIVYSVTQSDISKPRFGGSQPLNIAEATAQAVEDSLLQAWKERQTPHLRSQTQRAVLVLAVLALASLSLRWLQHRLAVRQSKLRQGLANSETTLPLETGVGASQAATTWEAIAPQFQKLFLRRRYSLNGLYSSGLFWAQWLLWLLGLGYLTSLFYWSRSFSNWIIGITIPGHWSQRFPMVWPPIDWLFSFGQKATLGVPLLILLMCLGTGITLKAGDAACDFLAQRWSQKQINPRDGLRAPTLARAIKGWLRVLVFVFFGAILAHQLHQLGMITQIVAVILGFLSLSLSLASQDLLKDLIAGLLILWEDQYAVGDVIVVDGQGGLVENITLRLTQLRNLDGELITIPNRSIHVVRNLSSEWAQVNYAIEVGYDTDVDKVMAVMEEVAHTLYHDPDWRPQILEAPEILGIDNIAHTGILIRLIIKTQPLQQWPVGREFRRRLKNAFDQQGIDIGVPQLKTLSKQPDFSAAFENPVGGKSSVLHS